MLKEFTIIFIPGTLVLSVDKKWDRHKDVPIIFKTGLNQIPFSKFETLEFKNLKSVKHKYPV